MTLARPPVVSQAEWDQALAAMTEREVAVATAMHELAAARKRMPMVRVTNDYLFEGPDGRRSLPELFDGRTQLILYRFYFEEGVGGWPEAGCVGCSSFADGVPELGLLHARDITFAMASPAPQANLRAYAERMGWTDVPWYTICTERFSADFGVDEWFGLNVFLRDGDDVYRTYFLQHGEAVQSIGSVWSLMSLTPYGGQSKEEDVPEGWPQAPQSFWYRRHDEFDDLPPSAAAATDHDAVGFANEQCGNPTAEAPAAVVRAHGLARSSRAVPAQWRPLPVDHVEQARLGCAAPHDHRAEVRARAQRHHRLPRRRSEPRRARDERLGRGPSRVVAQPRGAPGRRHSIGAPAAAPGARTPVRRGRSVIGCGSAGSRSIRGSTRMPVRRSTETPVIVLEPR